MIFLPLLCLFQMKILSEGGLLPKIIEAYSRPTRIVRGKDVTHDLEVQNFETMGYAFVYLKTIITLLRYLHVHSAYSIVKHILDIFLTYNSPQERYICYFFLLL